MSEMVERVARAISADIDEGLPRFTAQRWEDLSWPAKAAAVAEKPMSRAGLIFIGSIWAVGAVLLLWWLGSNAGQWLAEMGQGIR